MALVKLVLETRNAPLPCRARCRALAGGPVTDAVREVGHVLAPDVRRKGIDENAIQLVELDGFSSSTPVSLVQNAISPGG
ncbi:hypothetical protein N803_04735 [Knoellia subterranea KCTC 19937]|uniref:Uncharacterized protein n=1 Tax=Knoellia subterranea KCTC 19937 TaxID=1385521 RepID=A0A0A0JIJ9_9MICO|nr:hypothetical protein N803_04735 [Knoellia subterranea KCTC 19937]